MYKLPGTRMPCLPILSCSLTVIPSPAPAIFSFASNLVCAYLSNQSQQEMWKVILLILILPNIQQPGGEGQPTVLKLHINMPTYQRSPSFSSC